MADFRQSLDLGMDLFDTRLRASTAVGVVLVVCRRLHMPRVEVAKFTVQRALFALPDASKLQPFRRGSPSTDNCRSDFQRPTESDHICKHEQKLQTELLRPLEICRGKRRRSDGRQLSHELANTTCDHHRPSTPLRHVNSQKREKLIFFLSGGATEAGNIGKGENGKGENGNLASTGCLQQKRHNRLCPSRRAWKTALGQSLLRLPLFASP